MAENESSIKLVVQRRIVVVSVVLFVGKLLAYFMTNSVGILTDALESIVNVVTGFISLYSISVSLKPKDKNHPFGHGKIESLSASVEGILIILAGILIYIEAIKRFFEPSTIQKLDYGIIIIALAGLANYLLGYFSIKSGRKHGSIALVAGGKHLQSDTYSTIGLIVGLLLLLYTKLNWLDSLIALIFGSIIIFTGYKILKETTSNLMDEADFSLLEKFTQACRDNRSPLWIDIHNLKIAKYGTSHHIDCDLTLPWYLNIIDAHREVDKLKQVIVSGFSEEIDFNIHTDACTPKLCMYCNIKDCKYRKGEFKEKISWTAESMIIKSS